MRFSSFTFFAYKHVIACTALLVFLATKGHGNEPGHEPLAINFSAISLGQPLREPLWLVTENQQIPLSIHNRRRSENIEYVGPNPMVFHRKLETEDGTEWEVVTEVEIASTLSQPLIFFMERDEGYRTAVIEDSFDHYPPGSYRFYNLTDDELMGRLGNEQVRMLPRQTISLLNPFHDDGKVPVRFVVREPGGYSPIYAADWNHYESFRYLIFIATRQSGDTGPIQFRIIWDRPGS